MTEDLLRAIVSDPSDITARLAYADELEAKGDPLGEFIRVQCELADRYPRTPDEAGVEHLDSDGMRLRRRGHRLGAIGGRSAGVSTPCRQFPLTRSSCRGK